MPIFESEWTSIRALVERVVLEIAGRRDQYFVTGKVIKRDEKKMLVWLKEFGDQPIPIVGFNSTVKYYDEDHLGVVRVKKAKILVEVPKLGTTVLVAREMGSRRLPRCLGEIQGKGWIIAEDE